MAGPPEGFAIEMEPTGLPGVLTWEAARLVCITKGWAKLPPEIAPAGVRRGTPGMGVVVTIPVGFVIATGAAANLLERPAAPMTPTGRCAGRPWTGDTEDLAQSSSDFGNIFLGGVAVRCSPILASFFPLGPMNGPELRLEGDPGSADPSSDS